MAWICPLCKRPFKNKNQRHSCISLDTAQLLNGKGDNVVQAYHKLINEIGLIGKMDVTAARGAIYLKSKSTFAAIKLKKNLLDIEFYAADEIGQFPIFKTLRTSKNRVVHYVRIEKASDIDKQLLQWLKESYRLITT